MEYPKEVIAASKQGKEEARILIDKGEFVRYRYKDIKTGKEISKYTILLRSEKGIEHYFIVPYQGRELVVKHTKENRNKKRKIWNQKNKKIIEF